MEDRKHINLLESVNVTTWHVFITWFFRFKTNNMLQNRFFDLMHLVNTKGSVDLLLTIYVRLNFLNQLHVAFNNINQNNVVMKHLHIESLYWNIKRIVQSFKSNVVIVP